jgi:hypothetical protein
MTMGAVVRRVLSDGPPGIYSRMNITTRTAIASLALAALIAPLSSAAIAQTAPDQETVTVYTSWQPDWDAGKFDAKHVMLGEVTNFTPYRLTIARRDGQQQTVDLKNGTLIFPTGATPTQGERAALVGYYSNGTFIANRVVLRP